MAQLKQPAWMSGHSSRRDLSHSNLCSALSSPRGFTYSFRRIYECQIRPRSGLALNYGISIANTPGTVDADYRGEIGIILINLGENDFCSE